MALFLPFSASNLASFQVHFRFVLGSFFKALPLFSRTCWLRSHYFSFFAVPAFPPGRSGPGLVRASGAGGHGWRRIVPGLTTILGYHLSAVLSSENGYVPNPWITTGETGRAQGRGPYAPSGFTQSVVPVGARRRLAQLCPEGREAGRNRTNGAGLRQHVY